ncbi:hypothetical protein [Sphingopyxis sp. JAI128]|uniref:hypothetical protein n=1 Tax=Sphingopyxis sp. JAI128 TaxID=2723066 RepID=UPI00161D410F|nr:hypothetical protein [Sphingopyxis sp. JAI128]MBB6424951.1 hypothetical protein [Sphingopyxis sp. JAI128]
MSVITTGNAPKLLWPGLNAVWGQGYEEHAKEYTDIFEIETSDKNYEEDVEMTGFGLAPVKLQGASIIYDTDNQQTVTRYQHVAYALGFILTEEEFDDNLYESRGVNRTRALAFSMRQTKENVAANIYNRGFDPAYTGADGQPLFSVSHPTLSGTQSNLLTGADMSEAAIEDGCIQIMQARNARGLKIALMPRSLHYAPTNAFNAERILKSVLQNDTADNAVNALRSMGLFPDGGKVNHYFTDPDAWFMRTNIPTAGMTLFQRKKATFAQDGDFDTSNLKYKAYERYSCGWSDFRAAYGNAGA